MSSAGAAAVCAGLIAWYVALGGASYRPSPVADPCAHRPWRAPEGIAATLEQVALSTADGAACALHVPREDLVLALATRDDLSRFAIAHDVSQADAERAIREGLVRAVDDAAQADAIGGGLARTLKAIAGYLPIGLVLDVLHGASNVIAA